MNLNGSISSKNQLHYSKTYGINVDTKTDCNNTLNVKSGLTLEHTRDEAAFSLKARVDTASFKYKSKTWSAGINAPNLELSGNAFIGGTAGVEGKASFVDVNASKTFDIGIAKINIDCEAGIGVACGINGGINKSSVTIGGKANIMPGVYVGANINIHA